VTGRWQGRRQQNAETRGRQAEVQVKPVNPQAENGRKSRPSAGTRDLSSSETQAAESIAGRRQRQAVQAEKRRWQAEPAERNPRQRENENSTGNPETAAGGTQNNLAETKPRRQVYRQAGRQNERHLQTQNSENLTAENGRKPRTRVSRQWQVVPALQKIHEIQTRNGNGGRMQKFQRTERNETNGRHQPR